MLRRLLVLAAAVALGTAAQAQTPPDCPPAPKPLTEAQVVAGMRDARDRGFLWRLHKDGRTSHLYGTIHVAKLEWMFPGPTVTAALRASDVIALEIDLLDPAQQRALVEARGSHPPEPLPQALAERIRALGERECVPAPLLQSLSPELQVATLVALSGRRDGLDPTYGIDLFLAGWARGAKLPIVSLESAATQAQALQMGEGADREAAIASAIDDIDAGRGRPMLLRIAAMWERADHAGLASYDEWCECRRTAAEARAMQRLLDDRHPALAEAIDRLHARGQRVFAAVGSLHMAGASAVQRLLEQRGYRVEPVEWKR